MGFTSHGPHLLYVLRHAHAPGAPHGQLPCLLRVVAHPIRDVVPAWAQVGAGGGSSTDNLPQDQVASSSTDHIARTSIAQQGGVQVLVVVTACVLFPLLRSFLQAGGVRSRSGVGTEGGRALAPLHGAAAPTLPKRGWRTSEIG